MNWKVRLLIPASIGLSSATAVPDRVSSLTPDRPGGEGVLCLMALHNGAAEVGRRCFPGRHPRFQAELERALPRFDDYVLRNSSVTAEDITEFKRRQGLVGAPEAALCQGDSVMIYESLRSAGVTSLRLSVDAALATQGTPTFGDCL